MPTTNKQRRVKIAMSTIEDRLLDILRASGCDLWDKTWRKYLHQKLGKHACDLIDLTTVELPRHWDDLDSPLYRSHLLPNNSQTLKDCIEVLRPNSDCLNEQLGAVGLPKLGKGALQKRLSNVLPTLINSPMSGAILAENPFPRLWREIANELARRIHARNYSTGCDPERLLLNGLLLTGYFWTCQLPEARLVRQVFNEPRQKPLGLRGFFVRVPEFISPSGVEDTPVPHVNASGGVRLHHEAFTQLLGTTAAESRQIASGNGLLHSILPIDSKSHVPKNLWGHVTSEQLHQGRDAAYRLYEHTVLAYLALACIEQLLRSWATNQSVTHIRASGHPLGVMEWLSKLNPTPALEEALRQIYDPSRANIRNRIMHGNLLEIEGKSLDTRLPIANARRFPLLAIDTYMPENISSVCMACLQQVDQEIASRATLTDADLAWTRSFVLTPDEVDFGYRLPVDFLTGNGLEWLEYVSRYLNSMMPALKQPFLIGFIGWLQRPFNESIPRFMALGVVFEAIYRLTVHVLGHSVLQVSRPNGTNQLKCQYRMLDARATGLCTETILDHIISPVDQTDRPAAKRTLRLALKARDAFSHGAITTLDGRASDGIGHLIVKSVQSLVSGGLQHLVNEAAYFEWQNSFSSEHGHHEECWNRGEKRVFEMIRRTAET